MASPEALTPIPGARDRDTRREFALQRVDGQIEWYETHSTRQWWAFAIFQSAAVVLGGLTPVLILWSGLPKAVQALPAALAAMAAGLVGIFRWPHNKTRYSFTAEALKSERVKYATRTTSRYKHDLRTTKPLTTLSLESKTSR
jgi:hypothetical protein